VEEDEDEEDGAREQCSDPWTTLVSIVSVCTVSVAYANGRGDPEGTASRWEINHALHASSASRRAARLLSRKTGLPFPPHRAPAAAHSPSGLTPSARRPSRSSRSRSLYTSEASHLSLSLSLSLHPTLFDHSSLPATRGIRLEAGSSPCFFLVLRFDGCLCFAWIDGSILALFIWWAHQLYLILFLLAWYGVRKKGRIHGHDLLQHHQQRYCAICSSPEQAGNYILHRYILLTFLTFLPYTRRPIHACLVLYVAS
jgi:hypothetical protein